MFDGIIPKIPLKFTQQYILGRIYLMKRLISFTMALLICLLSLTACGEVQQEETQKTDDTAATPTETEAETISLTPNWDAVEKTNLNGISIDIACPGASLTYYDALDVEEITGDQLNDAIYNRNRALEEQMDFKLNALPGTGAASALMASVTAGSGDWDLALALIQGNGATLLKQGYLRSFNSLENVDMTMPWWDQSAIDTMAVNGQMFFGMMDFSVDIYESLTVLFYNGELIDRFQLEDPYALYQESAWTIDKMLEMIETVANDENGDGKFDINTDVYGLSGREYGFQPIFFSSGMEIVTFNDEEQKFQHNLTDERYVAIAEAVANLYDDIRDGVEFGYTDASRNAFKAGRVLFYSRLLGDYNLLRDQEDDYGIIAFPRYDYSSEKSLCFVQNPNAIFLPIVVGDDNGDGKQDYAEIGAFLQAVGAYTYDITKEVYIDNAVIGKGARDANSAEMVRHLLENKGFCLGQTYSFDMILTATYNSIVANSRFASAARAVEKQFVKIADNTVAVIQDAVAKQEEFIE